MAAAPRRPPRLVPASPDDADERTSRVFEQLEQYASPSNPVLGVLMLQPDLAAIYMPFSDYMKNHGRLSTRHRRLAIMRTAWNCGADFQWVAHARYARGEGVSEEEIERVAGGSDAAGWSDSDAAILTAADELHWQRRIGAATWERLREHLDPPSLVELIMLIGNYQMIALLMNAVEITPAEDPPNLPGNNFARWKASTLED